MSTDHDRLRDLLGAYVLGGLDAADRAQLGSHLSTCASCRAELVTYAGLPALLRFGDPSGRTSESETSGAGLVRALDSVRVARTQRRRLAVAVAAAAVVVLVLVVTTSMLVSRQGDGTPGIGLVAAADSQSRGETRLSARPWGTSVDLDLSGLPTGQRFVVWVVASDGTRQQAATWASTPDGQAHVTGASAVDTGDVSAVRVTTSEGTLLLSAEI